MTARSRRARTDQELQQASTHVYYEFATLHDAVRLMGGFQLPEQQAERNVCVESFAVHARNLHEFAYGDKLKDSYIHASDFVHDWTTVRPSWPFSTQELPLLGRAGREIVHLSWSRVTVPNTPWPMGIVAGFFGHVATRFMTHARRESLNDDWHKELARLHLTNAVSHPTGGHEAILRADVRAGAFAAISASSTSTSVVVGLGVDAASWTPRE